MSQPPDHINQGPPVDIFENVLALLAQGLGASPSVTVTMRMLEDW